MSEALQTVEKILDSHRRATGDRLRTVDLLEAFHRKQDKAAQHEIDSYLEQILLEENLASRATHGVEINLPIVALIAIARFGAASLGRRA